MRDFRRAWNKVDYYKVLNVSKNATALEVKQAYRRAVLMNHPDLHPDDEDKQENMKTINEAYSVLGSPERRAEYDRNIEPLHDFPLYKNYAYTYMFFTLVGFWFKYTRLCLSVISSRRV